MLVLSGCLPHPRDIMPGPLEIVVFFVMPEKPRVCCATAVLCPLDCLVSPPSSLFCMPVSLPLPARTFIPRLFTRPLLNEPAPQACFHLVFCMYLCSP